MQQEQRWAVVVVGGANGCLSAPDVTAAASALTACRMLLVQRGSRPGDDGARRVPEPAITRYRRRAARQPWLIVVTRRGTDRGATMAA
jgi:hypothetical protein